MEPGNFDPRHSGELLKHMNKQNEVLMEAHRSMLHELQKLQVEEEMLMRKLYEVMSAHGLTKKELNSPIRKSMQRMRKRNDMILVNSLVESGLRPNPPMEMR